MNVYLREPTSKIPKVIRKEDYLQLLTLARDNGWNVASMQKQEGARNPEVIFRDYLPDAVVRAEDAKLLCEIFQTLDPDPALDHAKHLLVCIAEKGQFTVNSH